MSPPYPPAVFPLVDPVVAAQVARRGSIALACSVLGAAIAGGSLCFTQYGFSIGGPTGVLLAVVGIGCGISAVRLPSAASAPGFWLPVLALLLAVLLLLADGGLLLILYVIGPLGPK